MSLFFCYTGQMLKIAISGMDGAGKTSALNHLVAQDKNYLGIKMPFDNNLLELLKTSGNGTSFGDTWTDRLIFALDNRLTNYRIKELEDRSEIKRLYTQRGWMDSFIHGKAQKYSYQVIENVCRVSELTKFDLTIYMICSPETAWDRIKFDSNKDKFENPEYLQKQFDATMEFIDDLIEDDLLRQLFPEPFVVIRTDDKTIDEVQFEIESVLRNAEKKLSIK